MCVVLMVDELTDLIQEVTVGIFGEYLIEYPSSSSSNNINIRPERSNKMGLRFFEWKRFNVVTEATIKRRAHGDYSILTNLHSSDVWCECVVCVACVCVMCEYVVCVWVWSVWCVSVGVCGVGVSVGV